MQSRRQKVLTMHVGAIATAVAILIQLAASANEATAIEKAVAFCCAVALPWLALCFICISNLKDDEAITDRLRMFSALAQGMFLIGFCIFLIKIGGAILLFFIFSSICAIAAMHFGFDET